MEIPGFYILPTTTNERVIYHVGRHFEVKQRSHMLGHLLTHLPIIRMRNRDQYRMSIRGVSGLALEESKMQTFSRI